MKATIGSETQTPTLVLPDAKVFDLALANVSAEPDSQPLSAHPIKRVLESLLIGYRYGLSRLDGPSCGFYPSCSRYSSLAVKNHGPLQGVLMTGDRLLRCHPDSEDDAPRLSDGRRIDWPE